MDTIHISELSVETHIGVYEEERKYAQKLTVHIWMERDITEAATADDITKTVDYEKVAHAIKNLAQKERRTIEAFAEDIAQMILREFETESVTVSVNKYILPDAEKVAVTITRPS